MKTKAKERISQMSGICPSRLFNIGFFNIRRAPFQMNSDLTLNKDVTVNPRHVLIYLSEMTLPLT